MSPLTFQFTPCATKATTFLAAPPKAAFHPKVESSLSSAWNRVETGKLSKYNAQPSPSLLPQNAAWKGMMGVRLQGPNEEAIAKGYSTTLPKPWRREASALGDCVLRGYHPIISITGWEKRQEEVSVLLRVSREMPPPRPTPTPVCGTYYHFRVTVAGLLEPDCTTRLKVWWMLKGEKEFKIVITILFLCVPLPISKSTSSQEIRACPCHAGFLFMDWSGNLLDTKW